MFEEGKKKVEKVTAILAYILIFWAKVKGLDSWHALDMYVMSQK